MEQVLALGGGCFWCTEAVFREVRGVIALEVGYCNGHTDKVDYEAVCTGRTGYCEVVHLRYDSAQVQLEELLEVFFLIHDPTTLNRQGHDVGTQYRSGIYWTQQAQADRAQAWLDAQREQGLWDRPVVTEIAPLDRYQRAEEYHQDFFTKNPAQGYCLAVAAPKVAKFRQTLARLRK
ncbi:peptide-methionine (S)-S-oxide reductase MsrA [Curvibacter sp. APW13]|uniref:peptide-methionine (S)-S-oxide reductase MsrA n=1 Tax=Curvibacter sp. APW13 TaxID=3077236 RepID=UPI0028E02E8A|nr:peptide-methionine (S)-S-oxide reductase MsrA [Curvibacter sp. APW13]MDT8991841.1 peptide-methionine (S)-S-oxide reductase MsrA [Curvibacter sp. APW13]